MFVGYKHIFVGFWPTNIFLFPIEQDWTILTLSSPTKANYPQRKMIKPLNKAQDHEKVMQLYLP
jgi:hypothetical protein